MCNFISWINYKDENYYLTSADLQTKAGKELLKSSVQADLCGHGAILRSPKMFSLIRNIKLAQEIIKTQKANDDPTSGRRYRALEDILKGDNKVKALKKKMNPLCLWFLELPENLYNWFWNLRLVPGDLKFNYQRFVQRGKRGWAYTDTWGLDDYLARVIKEGCAYLLVNPSGHPCDLTPEKWDHVLREIIWTFSVNIKYTNHEFSYIQFPEHFDKKIYNSVFKLYKQRKTSRPMTYKESVRYGQGWEYFRKYFWNLAS